ncbi:hypothetical protein GCM10027418_25450 [Mariniluteicoccus endophyticus]
MGDGAAVEVGAAVGVAGGWAAGALGVGVAEGVRVGVAVTVTDGEAAGDGVGVGAACARPGIDSASAATVRLTADETTGFIRVPSGAGMGWEVAPTVLSWDNLRLLLRFEKSTWSL